MKLLLKEYPANFILLKLFFLFFLLINNGRLCSQDYMFNDSVKIRILYEFTQIANKNKELVTLVDTMTLDVGQNWSEYYDAKKNKRDSISGEFMTKEVIERGREISVTKNPTSAYLLENRDIVPVIPDGFDRNSFKIFKNRLKNNVFSQDQFSNNPTESIVLVENLVFNNWKLDNDTLTILGYLCYKASTSFRGRDYLAWFTLDIPVDDGPWKFYGLPGLILKVEDSQKLFEFRAIGIQNKPGGIINFPSDKNRISDLSKYNNLRKNKLRKISPAIIYNNTLLFIEIPNPVRYNEMEIEE